MGQRTKVDAVKPRILINPPVFYISSVLVIAFVLFAALTPDTASEVFGAMRDWTLQSAGWFYVLAVAFFIVFVVVLAVSGFGHIKLGPDHSQPDYSHTSWFAMLFSAGMGIGLMFFGVAEPTNPTNLLFFQTASWIASHV
jgi:choline/glycine/proline betaine transport protein